MKHLLNNLSEEEKNRIREQHTGGMKVATDRFKMLVETRQGDVKPYVIKEEDAIEPIVDMGAVPFLIGFGFDEGKATISPINHLHFLQNKQTAKTASIII